MTNSVDRRVGLSRDQYDRIYRVNIRYASREIGPGERDRAYRRIMGPRQWDRYVGRGPAPRRDYRPAPPPRRDYDRRGRGSRDRRRY